MAGCVCPTRVLKTLLVLIVSLLAALQPAAAAEAAAVQMTAEAAAAGAATNDTAGGVPAQLLYLYCNTTSSCQPCGSLRLNEHCRAAGGYATSRCVVGGEADGDVFDADFRRPLNEEHTTLHEGSIISQHHACTPQSRMAVGVFLGLCAGLAAAALVVVRIRAQQLRRLGL